MDSRHLDARKTRLSILERMVNSKHKNKACESVALASAPLAIADMGEVRLALGRAHIDWVVTLRN